MRKDKVEAYYNSKKYTIKKPKRANRWYRVVNESEYEYVKNCMNYGMFINSVAQIFTLDEAIVQAIVYSSSYNDYVKKITKVIEEGKPDETNNDIQGKETPVTKDDTRTVRGSKFNIYTVRPK